MVLILWLNEPVVFVVRPNIYYINHILTMIVALWTFVIKMIINPPKNMVTIGLL